MIALDVLFKCGVGAKNPVIKKCLVQHTHPLVQQEGEESK